jgi:adenylate cyclase
VATSQRRLAAIMFTDMVGYTALAQADEAVALEVLGRHNRLLRPVFAKFRGREVKTVGDAFLVEFQSALDAVQCAVEIQRILHEYNLSSSDRWRVRIRIGVHVGDVVQANGDVLGDAVNVASRIEPLADPDGICVTQQVFDQIQTKIALPMVKLAPRELKNVSIPVGVYKIVQPWEPAGPAEAIPLPLGGRHLAVLPLSNISPDPRDEYFADGLTEELITALSQVRDLSVIARTSVVPYKSAPKSISQVGTELGVDTILEGSVRKSGNRVRITLQLINVATQAHIWANTYNREVDDVFAVQTDIAERTANSLRLELSRPGAGSPDRKPLPAAGAYDAYLKGLVAAMQEGGVGITEAVNHFEQATQLDPGFAEAFAAWANLYVVAAGDFLPMREVMPKARALAARALKLDPESSEAHAALGNIAFQFDHNWSLAESEFRRAIAINPSNVTAHRFLGSVFLALGRFEESKEEVRREIRLDPAGYGHLKLSMTELMSGNADAAIEDCLQMVRTEPLSVGLHCILGIAYITAGRKDDALREAQFPIADANETERFDHALLNAVVGRPEAARRIATETERGEAKSYTSATHLSLLYSALGEKTRALDLLEQDYREGDRVLWTVFRGIWYDSIRDDPRFVALLREYGLPLGPPPRPVPPSH